jgi:hypothetical protein
MRSVTAQTTMFQRWQVLILIVSPLIFMNGCLMVTSTTIEEGRPIDEAKVKQIVIGQTKRRDVYELFGPPHSQFQGQVEFKEGSLRGFFSHIENRYLSSLDDRHYAMLYRFVTSKAEFTGGTAVVVTLANTKGTIKSDELLLLLEKETDMVVDVAYRK